MSGIKTWIYLFICFRLLKVSSAAERWPCCWKTASRKEGFRLTAAGEDRHETEHAASHGDEREFFGRLHIQSCRERKAEKGNTVACKVRWLTCIVFQYCFANSVHCIQMKSKTARESRRQRASNSTSQLWHSLSLYVQCLFQDPQPPTREINNECILSDLIRR